jgi:hypothetical protein
MTVPVAPSRQRQAGNLGGRGRHRLLAFLLALIALAGAAPHAVAAHAKDATKDAAASCPAPNATPIAPDDIHGVVSRVQIAPKVGKAFQYSVQPDLMNLDLDIWMRSMEAVGVNIAEIHLQPIAMLANDQKISDSEWDAYIDAAFIPHEKRSPEQRDAYKAMRGRIGALNGVAGITPEQQSKILIAFLDRLEALKKSGRICGNVQFLLEQRRWFPNPRRWDDKFDNVAMYAKTVADFVNKAKDAGLGHWLAGVILTEHTNTDMNQLLPITVDIAAHINDMTDGWLKSHFMAAAGGGFGDQFNGIDAAVCPATDSRHRFSCTPGEPLDFFKLISAQTGTFAFAYKLFNWRTAPTPPNYCTAHLTGCDPRNMTAANWADYLSDSENGLGFKDLVTAVSKNAQRYPHAANVIFIGNSSDSLFRMVEQRQTPSGTRLVAKPELQGLTTIFQDASHKGGGWSGSVFMEPYGDLDRQADPDHMPQDAGLYLYFRDYSPFDFQGGSSVYTNPESQAYWHAWPKLPPQAP